jgi:hypothetical protein
MIKYWLITYNNKQDISGISKTIKTQYKQLKLRTYDVTFYKTKYDIYVDHNWWKISIYDSNNKTVLHYPAC